MQNIDFLIVDDCQDAAQSLALVLELMGHSAAVAFSGEEALAAVNRIKPICVMLDIAMPGMDGLELARQLRARYGDDVVLVAVTGASPDVPRVKQTFVTVDHYLHKPVSAEHLARLLPGSSSPDLLPGPWK